MNHTFRRYLRKVLFLFQKALIKAVFANIMAFGYPRILRVLSLSRESFFFSVLPVFTPLNMVIFLSLVLNSNKAHEKALINLKKTRP